jgi:hypothetical protein
MPVASWFETREDALLTMRESRPDEEHRESDASRRMDATIEVEIVLASFRMLLQAQLGRIAPRSLIRHART